MTAVELEKSNSIMSLAVASLRAARTEALRQVEGSSDIWSGDWTAFSWSGTAKPASLSFLNGEALRAIDSLDTVVRARVVSGAIKMSSWSATAGELYKTISGIANVADWAMWSVLRNTVDATYSELAQKIADTKPYALGAVAVAVLVLILLVFLRVA